MAGGFFAKAIPMLLVYDMYLLLKREKCVLLPSQLLLLGS